VIESEGVAHGRSIHQSTVPLVETIAHPEILEKRHQDNRYPDFQGSGGKAGYSVGPEGKDSLLIMK